MFKYSPQYFYEKLFFNVNFKCLLNIPAENQTMQKKHLYKKTDDQQHTKEKECEHLKKENDKITVKDKWMYEYKQLMEDSRNIKISKYYNPDPAGLASLRAEYETWISNRNRMIYKVEEAKELMLTSYISVRYLRFLENYLTWRLGLIVLIFLYFIVKFSEENILQLIYFFLMPIMFVLIVFISIIRKNVEKNAIADAGDDWIFAEKLIDSHRIELNKILAEKKETEDFLYSKWKNSYPPDWSYRREKIKNRDSYICLHCGYPMGFKRSTRKLHVHHKIPISKGGTHDSSNLITLCSRCHYNTHRRKSE